MKRIVAMLAVAITAGLAGCDRPDESKVYDGTIDGVVRKQLPAVDMTILENQTKLAEDRARTGGSAGSGGAVAATQATTAATATAPATSPATTGEAPAATQEGGGGTDTVPLPPG